jgi:DNA mismatch endonuclease (patch repair protein)
MKIYGPESRRDLMNSIKSSGNQSTEVRLMRWFVANNITGWKCQYDLIGEPDFVFPRLRLVIFASSCSLNDHQCLGSPYLQYGKALAKRTSRNADRNEIIDQNLSDKGWHVVRIWECELDNDFVLASKLLKYL